MAATLELQRLRAFNQARTARHGTARHGTARHGMAGAGASQGRPLQASRRLPPCTIAVARPLCTCAHPSAVLRSCPQVSYTSSRNRQWHIYSVTERKHRHSLALKRVFLR